MLQAGKFSFDLSSPLIMGILNITPDSFSDGGKYNQLDTALRHAERMLSDGADIIDIGAESTRPGADFVSEDQELYRLIPIIEALNREFDCCLSIDTNKPNVISEVLKHDVSMINDVTGFINRKSLSYVANSAAAICIMHMKGTPKTMQYQTDYDDVCANVLDFLLAQAEQAQQYGIGADRIVVDPGFGFGKTVSQNCELVKNLSMFTQKYPVLMGLSKKSTLGHLLEDLDQDRLIASLVGGLVSIAHGASILRVHDVKETVDAITIYRAMS